MSKWSVFPRGHAPARPGTGLGPKLAASRSHGDTAKKKRTKTGPAGLSLGDSLTAWKQDQEFPDEIRRERD